MSNHWDAIGGQREAKLALIEAIELPYLHPELYRYYGKRLTKGVLLYGPPGCGKTMLGKAAAASIGSKDGFIYVSAPSLLRGVVGEGEKEIRDLFAKAREYKRSSGRPPVLFIDEADALLGNRSNPNIKRASCHGSTIASFLTEIDGFEECAAIVILATNRPDDIDPAVVRDGRIDRKIKIDRPGLKESETILGKALQHVPVSGCTQTGLAKLMAREFFSSHRSLFNLHTETGIHVLKLAHVVNGAMLVGAVDQACSLALHRDLLANKRTGLRKADVIRAIDGIQRQQLDLDHSDAARELAETLGGKVVRVEKAKPENRPKPVAEPSLDGPANIFEEVA